MGDFMNSNVRNAVLWLIVLCLVVLGWAVFRGSKPPGPQPTFSDLVKDVKDGKVEKISLNSSTGDVHGKYKNGDSFTSVIPPSYDKFTDLMIEHGVAVKFEKDTGNIWANFLSGLIILFERPIKVGDRIDVGSITGDVVKISPRATTIVKGKHGVRA